MEPGPELDARRARVVDTGLTGAAVEALTPLVRSLPVDALTAVKQLLKQFFSGSTWTSADDVALADAVGPAPAGAAPGRVDLASDVVLEWSWVHGRFCLRLGGPTAAAPDA